MSKQITNTYDRIQADAMLKQHTLDYLYRKTDGYRCKPRFTVRPALIMLAVSFLLLTGIGGSSLYFTPRTIISVDVNPSIELEINRFGHVIRAEAFNDDGIDILSTVDLRFLDYESALVQLLQNERMNAYLTDEYLVSISVFGDNEAVCDQMMNRLNSRIAGYSNVHCTSGKREFADEAHSVGLSCGKYKAYLELLALDPAVTTEEVKELTMRQIHDRINKLSGEIIYPDPGAVNHNGSHSGNGNGNGNGNGYGNGTGYGNGNGYGNGSKNNP